MDGGGFGTPSFTPQLTVLSVALQKSCGAVFPTSRAPRQRPRAPSPSRTVAAVSPTYKCQTALLDTRASLPVSTLSHTHARTTHPLYCTNVAKHSLRCSRSDDHIQR